MAEHSNMSRKRKHNDEENDDDFILYAGAAVWFMYIRRKERGERTLWCREWLLRRDDLGAYETLVSELRDEDPKSFLNFLRISPGLFEGLLDMVSPLIKRENTSCRKAISPGMRLAITLRYLATGK